EKMPRDPRNWKTSFYEKEAKQHAHAHQAHDPDDCFASWRRGRILDKSVSNRSQAKSQERGALPIETFACCFVTTLRDAPQRKQDYDKSEWKIDEEDPTPRCIFHQPAAQDRPDSSSDRCEARPGADGPPALVLCIRGADNGQ